MQSLDKEIRVMESKVRHLMHEVEVNSTSTSTTSCNDKYEIKCIDEFLKMITTSINPIKDLDRGLNRISYSDKRLDKCGCGADSDCFTCLGTSLYDVSFHQHKECLLCSKNLEKDNTSIIWYFNDDVIIFVCISCVYKYKHK